MIRDGSYGDNSDLAQNNTDDAGDKQGTVHEDYNLNQRAPAREEGLTKETWGEYLLRIFGGTILYFLYFFSLRFQIYILLNMETK